MLKKLHQHLKGGEELRIKKTSHEIRVQLIHLDTGAQCSKIIHEIELDFYKGQEDEFSKWTIGNLRERIFEKLYHQKPPESKKEFEKQYLQEPKPDNEDT